MTSPGKYYIDIFDENNKSIISDELSLIKIRVIDKIGEITRIESIFKSTNPSVIRDKYNYKIRIEDLEPFGIHEYNCGLLSSTTIGELLSVVFLACPFDCFATKHTRNLGTNLIDSINNINKYFSVNAINATKVLGNYNQFNMRDIDIAIELSKGVAFDSIVCYDSGVFNIINIKGVPQKEDYLGTIKGNIDFYNAPYRIESINNIELGDKISTFSYMGYYGSTLGDSRLYYSNYFNNIKFYLSYGVSFKMNYEYARQEKLGTYVSATLDTTNINSFMIVEKSVTYENKEVNSTLTIGDLTNELRTYK